MKSRLEEEMIGLGGYRVLSWERVGEKRVDVHVEPKEETRSCRHCGNQKLHSKGRYTRKVRHLPIFGAASRLLIHTRRLRCLRCLKVFVPKLQAVLPGRHSTEPFRSEVYEHHHRGIAASNLAELLKLGSATVARIYNQFTARKASERVSMLCPMVLGIDEHTLHKGNRFVTTFCDLKNHRVFDVVPGKSERDLAAFIHSLQGKEKVRVVCIDLSSPYRSLIEKWFPNAKIVADRFHVIRVVIHHFLALCRKIAPEIKNNRGALALLRMNRKNLTAAQKLRLLNLFKTYPAFQPLYEQMHKLRALLNVKNRTKKQCKALAASFCRHISELVESRFEPLQTLANTLQNWAQPIARMWRFTKSNGITEGFHRKMKLIQRRAYGFRNFLNYRLRVIAQCG